MMITGRHYQTGEPIRVETLGERIHRVERITPRDNIADWPWLSPGLFDLQVNGYGGIWFSHEGLQPTDVETVLTQYLSHGVTRLCPTLVTNSFEALRDGFAAINAACRTHPWIERMVPGCHLEGPYIASEDGPRGAHPLPHVRRADWDEFTQWQEASGGRIRLVTVAPEQDGVIDFIRTACEHGIVISIGHTAATPEQITAAVDAGARMSTHLGNGAHGNLPRHPNYIWQQLGDPRLYAGVITDGHHLPAAVVRSIIGNKGLQRTVITCDASGLAGCPPGRYHEDKIEMEILEDGRIVVAGQRQYLAGSGHTTEHCVARAIEYANLPLSAAIDMAGRNPAVLLGYEEHRLRRGSRADLLQFHWQGPGSNIEPQATILAGEVRYGTVQETVLV